MSDERVLLSGARDVKIPRKWWLVRARNDRYTILTRQADFQPKGVLLYTIIDGAGGVRGPCNLIGQGWDFTPETVEQDAKRLLQALIDGEVEVSHRNRIPARILATRKDGSHE